MFQIVFLYILLYLENSFFFLDFISVFQWWMMIVAYSVELMDFLSISLKCHTSNSLIATMIQLFVFNLKSVNASLVTGDMWIMHTGGEHLDPTEHLIICGKIWKKKNWIPCQSELKASDVYYNLVLNDREVTWKQSILLFSIK